MAKNTLEMKSKNYDTKNDSLSLSKNKEYVYSNILLENKSVSPGRKVPKFSSQSKRSLNNIDDFSYKLGKTQKLKLTSPLNKRRRNEKNIEFPVYSSRKDLKVYQFNNNSVNKIDHHLDTDDYSQEKDSRSLKLRLKESQSKKLNLPNQNTSENYIYVNNNNRNLSTEYFDFNNNIVEENQEYIDEFSLSNQNLNKILKKTINSSKDKPLITSDSVGRDNHKIKRPFSLVIKTENKKESSMKVPALDVGKASISRPSSQFLSNKDKNRIISYRDKKDTNISAKISKKNSAENINIKTNFSSKHFQKYDILSKISKFDERKITKLAKLIEKFEYTDNDEEFKSPNKPKKSFTGSLKSSRKSGNLIKEKPQSNNKYNINYIQTENVNFGNINISLNNANINRPINSSSINKELINNIKNILLDKSKQIEEEKELTAPHFSDKRKKNYELFSNIKEKTNLSHISNYSVISFLIQSTWGNLDKVGLTEIQIFDKKGKKINIIECHVFNGSEDGINKIINNKFHIIEESEMWVSRFSKDLKIEIYFEAIYEVESIVVWNFNGKDLSKGVKEVHVFKKNSFVWKGIINKGSYNNRVNYSTLIVLNNSEKDKYNFEISDLKLERNILKNVISSNQIINQKISKENTIDKRNSCESNDTEENKLSINHLKSSTDSIKNEVELKDLILNQNDKKNGRNQRIEASKNNSINYLTSEEYLRKSNSSVPSIPCKSVTIIITSNWGDPNFVGLTQIQFLDQNFKKINENEILSYITFPNNNLEANEFENLFDGNYETTDDLYMWQTEFSSTINPCIEIQFNKPQVINGIKIWNFNKKDELDKGVKSLDIRFDDNNYNKERFPFLLRRALGKSNYDYSQTLYFMSCYNHYTDEDLNILQNYKPASLSLKQDYETPFLPTGFVFKLIFLTNFGDQNYIGLDGIELYDHLGKNALKNNILKVLIFPEDYEIGEKNNHNQMKSSSKNSLNNYFISKSGRLSFISPYLDHKNIDMNEGLYNIIYFIFDKPISVSYFRFFNYSEKRICGVNEYILLCDEEVIYKGCLRKFDESKDSTCVFFTSEKNIVLGLEDKIYSQLLNKKEYVFTEKEKDNTYELSLFQNWKLG